MDSNVVVPGLHSEINRNCEEAYILGLQEAIPEFGPGNRGEGGSRGEVAF